MADRTRDGRIAAPYPTCDAVRAAASRAQESALKTILRAGALRDSSLIQNKAET